MMFGRVMFGVIVAHVDDELSLKDPISDPIKTHVHGAGSSFLDGVVGDAGGCRVVRFYWSRRLRMTEFVECGAKYGGFLAVDEECANFSFGGGGHDVF